MTAQTLVAQKRMVKGKKNLGLRQEARVPAIVYGAGLSESLNISLDRVQFVKLYERAGESTVVELAIDQAAPVHALIQDFQVDPLRGEVIHVDFRAIDMTRPIEAEVKLKFTGDAAAVKALGGTLITPLTVLRIRALPKDLVPFLEVHLEKLATFDDAVHVEDIVLPVGIEVLAKSNQTVAIVAPPRSDAEMASLDEAVVTDVSAVEVVGAKKEEEEGAEGEEGETKASVDGKAPEAVKAADDKSAPKSAPKKEKK